MHVYVKMAAECNKTIYKCVQLMVLMLLSFFFEVNVFQFSLENEEGTASCVHLNKSFNVFIAQF